MGFFLKPIFFLSIFENRNFFRSSSPAASSSSSSDDSSTSGDEQEENERLGLYKAGDRADFKSGGVRFKILKFFSVPSPGASSRATSSSDIVKLNCKPKAKRLLSSEDSVESRSR